MPEITVVEAVNQALTLEMARDNRVVVFGEDVGRSGGVFRATDGLYAKHGADRVIDTPLSEGVIAGAAIGLALAGWVPVAEIQFLGFVHNGFNQV
ncbi:MAG: alpha-ketoacid dehydrogenase subunit beta, partial [Candidatus Dormibacteraeota bacterium]|nr:alpha-ketoacid dehydrogenase subunit beta [Candidatus Dormibacteraeota bacterium]